MRNLDTKEDFDAFLKEAGDQLVVIDFYATWCGPCKMIAPKLEQMQKEFPDVKFAKVDVDENEDTAEECEVSAMPSFRLFKKGEQIAEMAGANEAKLRELIETHK